MCWLASLDWSPLWPPGAESKRSVAAGASACKTGYEKLCESVSPVSAHTDRSSPELGQVV